MKNLRTAVGVAAVALTLGSTSYARETCMVITLKDDYRRASFVLLGEVLPRDGGIGRYKVIRAWKGDPPPEVSFATKQFQRQFEPGQTVLVFAYRDAAGVPYLHDCSHTNPVTSAYVEQQVRTLSSRSRWWDCPISSFLRPTPKAP